MKILVVTHYAPPHKGGIEFVAWEQIKRFRRMGHEVVWFSSDLPPGSASAPPADFPPDYSLIRWPALNFLESYGVPYPIFHPGMSARVRRLVEQADVVHVHGMIYQGTSAALRWARRRGKGVVMTSHVIDRARGIASPLGTWGQRLAGAAMHAAEKWAHNHIGRRNLQRSDAVVLYNDEVYKYVKLLLPAARIEFIPNGVDTVTYVPADSDRKLQLRRQWGLPPDRLVICFIGRLVPRKGAHLVLAGAPPEAFLFFVGEGRLPEATALSGRDPALLKRLPAQPREKIAEILQASDVLALPSLGEGFPLIAQEAMAAGLPVLLANDPGYGSFINGRVAMLVEPTVEGVRAGLARLAADNALRRSLGQAARNHVVEHFSWEINAERHLKIFEDVIRLERDKQILNHE